MNNDHKELLANIKYFAEQIELEEEIDDDDLR